MGSTDQWDNVVFSQTERNKDNKLENSKMSRLARP